MLALAIFLGVIAFAFLVGAGAFWLLRRHSKWIAIPASFVLALCAILFAAVTFLVAYGEFPASDKRNWSELDRIEIFMDTSAKPTKIDERALKECDLSLLESRFGSKCQNLISPDLTITITYPAETLSGNDITVVLTVSATAKLPMGELRAVLRSQSLKAWTTQSCPSMPSGLDAYPACVNLLSAKDSIEFIWTASATSQGIRQVAVEVPPVWQGDEWTAILVQNSIPILFCDSYENYETCRFRHGPPLLLSVSSASYGGPRGDFSVDLSRRDVRLPIKVLTTLGLSTSTYGWLAIVGVVLSGALGSGWLFKLVESLRSPSERPKPTRRNVTS